MKYSKIRALLPSSRIPSTFKVAIEKAAMTYQWQPDRQKCSDKRKLEGVGSHYEGKENVPVFQTTRQN